MKNLMDKTLARRRKWTELPQVVQILEMFPILKRAHLIVVERV